MCVFLAGKVAFSFFFFVLTIYWTILFLFLNFKRVMDTRFYSFNLFFFLIKRGGKYGKIPPLIFLAKI